MDSLPKVGRFMFAVPMAMFGIMHFMNAGMMAEMMVPSYIPGALIVVYLTGVALIAAAVAISIDKHGVLASRLLALFLVLTALMVWLPAAMADMSQAGNLLKDIALAGGALVLSGVLSPGDSTST